jgi:hypothetical protein
MANHYLDAPSSALTRYRKLVKLGTCLTFEV